MDQIETCIEKIKSIVEINMSQTDLRNIIIKNNYDIEASINTILATKDVNIIPGRTTLVEKKNLKEKGQLIILNYIHITHVCTQQPTHACTCRHTHTHSGEAFNLKY